MRTTLLLLTAALFATSSAYCQSAPAAADRKSAAAEANGLTPEERKRIVDYLEETRKDLMAAVDGLSEEQWKFKASPDRWSIAETAEHITQAEETIWQLVSEKMMKSPAAPAPEKRAATKGKDETIVKGVPDRSRKAEAPERLQPTGRWATRAELLKAFETTRSAEISYLKETQEDLRGRFEEHPFLKAMDAYQWLLFNGAHSKRHTAQILEVKADPNFPKS